MPVYSSPPSIMTSQVLAQFNQLVSAIGRAIGNVAVHETGHQLALPSLDCGLLYNCPGAAPNIYIYQYYDSSSSAESFYADIPTKQLKWSSLAATCLEEYFTT